VGAAGTSHGTFQRACARGNLNVALATARELGRLTLEDALALTELLARVGDARFEAAAVRWVARYAEERRPALASLRLAVALVAALADEREGPVAHEALRAIVRRPQL
jgi:hypothetical protein